VFFVSEVNFGGIGRSGALRAEAERMGHSVGLLFVVNREQLLSDRLNLLLSP
jgi:hypothetical protein